MLAWFFLFFLCFIHTICHKEEKNKENKEEKIKIIIISSRHNGASYNWIEEEEVEKGNNKKTILMWGFIYLKD